MLPHIARHTQIPVLLIVMSEYYVIIGMQLHLINQSPCCYLKLSVNTSYVIMNILIYPM